MKNGVVFLLIGANLIAQTGVLGEQAAPPPGDNAPLLEGYQASWLANSYPGDGAHRWMQHWAYGMAVRPDGTVYLNTYWEEGGEHGGIYRDGKVIGQAEYHDGLEPSGDAVAVNTDHVFYTKGTSIVRYDPDGKKPVKLFDAGEEVMGLAASDTALALTTSKGAVRLYDLTGKLTAQWSAPQPGAIAIAANGDLFVATNVTRSGEKPGEHNQTWIAGDASPVVCRYSAAGALLRRSAVPKTPWIPSAVVVDTADPGVVLVADAGRNQQIYKLRASDLSVSETFGTPNGYLAGPVPGRTGPGRLMRPWGVGTDGQGNIYVLNAVPHTWSHRPVLQKYNRKGKLVWELDGLAWVDTVQPVSSADGRTLYSGSDRFSYDFSKPADGSHWKHEAVTSDPWTYKYDPREHSPFIITVGKTRLMYTIGQFSNVLAINRFDGDIAVPAGLLSRGRMRPEEWAPGHPSDGMFIWTDRNGNGQPEADEYQKDGSDSGETFCMWVDERGDIWDARYDPKMTGDSRWNIRRTPLQKLDKNGVPQYDLGKTVSYGNPPDMTEIGRLEYHPESDTMYMMGYTKAYPRVNDFGLSDPAPWGTAGRVLYRYDSWTKPERRLHAGYPIVMPFFVKTALGAASGMAGTVAADQRTVDFEGCVIPGDFVVPSDAGEDKPGRSYLFVVYGVNGPHTNDILSRNEIRAFDVATGKFVGSMVAKPPIDPHALGWLDTRRSLKGIRRSNGEYFLTTEEDYKGKFVLYRWNPGGAK